jgi:hypothetical protein
MFEDDAKSLVNRIDGLLEPYSYRSKEDLVLRNYRLPHLRIHEHRINHILIYGGAFNPPHAGHLNFLKDSFLNAGRDMNFICAIIMPCSDSYLKETKFKDTDNPLLLPYELRARLWYEDSRWPTWAAVLRRWNYGYDLSNLKKIAREMDIRIQFTLLSDAATSRPLECRALGLTDYVDNVLVNTWGRQGEENNHSLQSWNLEHPPWTALHQPGEKVERYHTTLSSRTQALRGSVRVIRAKDEKKSTISLEKVRILSIMRSDEELKEDHCLRDNVLSWELLLQDKMWQKWRSIELEKRMSEEERKEQIEVEGKIKEAWKAEVQ